uniref:Uncharacterized protein MANES_14G081000 n=1 Tax=Rhizophora mucronata TaxID=61149 RepID=A0A2P2JSW2_RHIMU
MFFKSDSHGGKLWWQRRTPPKPTDQTKPSFFRRITQRGMSTDSLCSSTQINGFGGGLWLQKIHFTEPSWLTLTRYCLFSCSQRIFD